MSIQDMVGKPKKKVENKAFFPSAKSTGVQTDTKKIIGGSIKKKKPVGHTIKVKNKIDDII